MMRGGSWLREGRRGGTGRRRVSLERRRPLAVRRLHWDWPLGRPPPLLGRGRANGRKVRARYIWPQWLVES